jgi:hypothetical protein
MGCPPAWMVLSPVLASMRETSQPRTRLGNVLDPDLCEMVINHSTAIAEDILSLLLETAVELGKPEWVRKLHALQPEEVIRWLDECEILSALIHPSTLNHNSEAAPCLDGLQETNRSDKTIKALLDIGVTVGNEHLPRALFARLSDITLATILQKRQDELDTVFWGQGNLLQLLLDDNHWNGTATAQERYLEILLQAGCDPNRNPLVNYNWSSTPLQRVCARSNFYFDPEKGLSSTPAHRHSDRLPFILLRRGAVPWCPPSTNRFMEINVRPLTLACVTGKLEVVEALLKAEAEDENAMSIPENLGDETPFGPPLQAACLLFGQRRDDPSLSVKLVKTLLAAGERVHRFSECSGSCLITATCSLLPEVVGVLLVAGADPSIEAPLKWLTGSTKVTAWAALEQVSWKDDFIQDLITFFQSLQTGYFKCGPLRDEAENEERRERIRKLFLQYRPSPSRGVPSPRPTTQTPVPASKQTLMIRKRIYAGGHEPRTGLSNASSVARSPNAILKRRSRTSSLERSPVAKRRKPHHSRTALRQSPLILAVGYCRQQRQRRTLLTASSGWLFETQRIEISLLCFLLQFLFSSSLHPMDRTFREHRDGRIWSSDVGQILRLCFD